LIAVAASTSSPASIKRGAIAANRGRQRAIVSYAPPSTMPA
jgi:hypothetical protein